jgi:hypothetical protein
LYRRDAQNAIDDMRRTAVNEARYAKDEVLRSIDEANASTIKAAELQRVEDLKRLQGTVRTRMDDSAVKKTSEVAAARVERKATEGTLKITRVKSGAGVGSDINGALSRAETTLTGDRVKKLALLKDATDSGITIDATPLLDRAQSLIDDASRMRGDLETNRNLDSLLATVKAKYGKPSGPYGAEISYNITPIEADDIMHMIRHNVKNAFDKAGGTSEMQQAFLELSHMWKENFYGTLEDAGKLSAGTRKALVAQENLRDFIDPKQPSAFADSLVRGGVGSEERWAALRAFEETHNTGRKLENTVVDLNRKLNAGKLEALDNFEKKRGAALAKFEADSRAASDLLKAEKEAGIVRVGNMREDANVRRMNLQRTHDAAITQAEEDARIAGRNMQQDVDVRMAGRERDLGVARKLQAGDRRGAMNMQISSPEEQRIFESANRLFELTNTRKPENIVNALKNAMTGEGDQGVGQSLLEALHNIEIEVGTATPGVPGAIHNEIRKIAQSRDWNSITPGLSGFVQLIRAMGKGAARIALVSGRAPVAAASIIGSRTMEPPKKVKAKEKAQ